MYLNPEDVDIKDPPKIVNNIKNYNEANKVADVAIVNLNISLNQKQELLDSMVSSRHQEYVRKEMDKIRAEGWQENSVSDTHKIIKEAERRVKERESHNS